MTYLVTNFYQFLNLTDLEDKRARWQNWGQAQHLRGTILLAPEGINVSLAGSEGAVRGLVNQIKIELGLSHLSLRESHSDSLPFGKFKVKLKKEIVTLGLPQVNPQQGVGIYVSPQHWNQLLQDPTLTVIDTRNHYEVAIGTFPGAVDPQTSCFREFPHYVNRQLDPHKHRQVALFCTGGIRCEKATALMVQSGFEQVYHLQGGILNYLATVPPQESLWQGECFVFDERVALQNNLALGHYHLCSTCGYPLAEEIICPHCFSLG